MYCIQNGVSRDKKNDTKLCLDELRYMLKDHRKHTMLNEEIEAGVRETKFMSFHYFLMQKCV